MGNVVPDSVFQLTKKCIHTYEKFTKYMK